MTIPPRYSITPEILELIAKIEANRLFLNSVTIPEPLKEKIQRINILKSALYSARIEGNDLTIEDFDSTRQKAMLPPRQEEIYDIIRDHKMISLDIIKRRFLKVPSRTLRYDLKKLQDKGLVIKIGTTRGSVYTIRR